MIEEVKLTGEISIPSVDGDFFCSRRDPIREAVQWYTIHREKIEKAERIVVVGLGAGFHIHFIPRDKTVVFIERRSELIQRFKALYPDSHAQEIQSLEDLESSEVLFFKPAFGSQLADDFIFYQSLESTHDRGEKMNIKLIEGLFSQSVANNEVKSWRILRELVA